MLRWGATGLVWALAPVAGLISFLAAKTVSDSRSFDAEESIATGFLGLWVAASVAVVRLHKRRGGRAIHVLGCVLLFPAWILVLLYSFL